MQQNSKFTRPARAFVSPDVSHDPPSDVAPDVATDLGLGESDEPRYVVRAKRLDRFNTVRTRVLLTPATCDRCGLDLVTNNRLPPWEKLTATVQAELTEALAEHKRIAHTAAEQLVVRESELPRQWLSNNR